MIASVEPVAEPERAVGVRRVALIVGEMTDRGIKSVRKDMREELSFWLEQQRSSSVKMSDIGETWRYQRHAMRQRGETEARKHESEPYRAHRRTLPWSCV